MALAEPQTLTHDFCVDELRKLSMLQGKGPQAHQADVAKQIDSWLDTMLELKQEAVNGPART